MTTASEFSISFLFFHNIMGRYSYQESDDIICTKRQRINLESGMNRSNLYLADSSLLPRVQKYLESNNSKGYIDINTMADDLQKRYARDYGKRKRNAFRTSVKKACQIVMNNHGVNNVESSSEDYSDESVVEDQHGDTGENSLSAQLLEMYGRNIILPQKPIDSNELIDISSDDSTEEQPKSNAGDSSLPFTAHMSVGKTPLFQGGKSALLPTPSSLLPASFVNHNHIPPQLTQSTPASSSNTRKRKMPNILLPTSTKDRNSHPSNNNASKTPSAISKSGPTPSKKRALALPDVTFKDLGGIDGTLKEICKLLVHVKHPEVYDRIGVTPPRGFLLHGPPGCGKTMLAAAIAGELGVPLLKVAAPELVAGVSGESEERIRELFERATASSPCVLFIDEIDAITQNRQFAQKDMERRIVAQLLVCLDDLNKNPLGSQVLIIGATNNPHALDPALRRAGRFDREVCMGIPDKKAREAILRVISANLQLEESMNFEELAALSPGFVGADLMSLVREAAMAAVNRVFNDLRNKRQLEQAITEEAQSRKQSEDAATKENDEDITKIDLLNNSDADIIVDDIKPTETSNNKIDSVENTADNDDNAVQIVEGGDSPVLIIDEETTKPITINGSSSRKSGNTDALTPTTSSPENATSQESHNGDIVVNVEKTEESDNSEGFLPVVSASLLDDMITWLHNTSPLSNEQLEGVCINMEDFQMALKSVQPSAKREGFATVPDTTWSDIGSLASIREELQLAILAPVKHAEQFESIGLSAPTGVLLCGPPGCGKTLLAKAIANEAGINFISVKGPELLNMYVGESERAVRVCFQRARDSAPCVIFFDELDALCPKRSDNREGGVTMRVVNQLLTEMDGIEGRKGVFILAASNRPDIIDPAVLRPGRLDKLLYVGLPNGDDRVDILRTITKNGTRPCLGVDVDLEIIGKSEKCDGYTGADLAALVREASVQALKDLMIKGDMEKPAIVSMAHFTKAILKIRPSVTEKDQLHYEKLRKVYSVKSDVEEMELS